MDNERVSGVKSVRQQRPKSARPTRNSNFPVATDFSEAGSVVEEKDEYFDEDFRELRYSNKIMKSRQL